LKPGKRLARLLANEAYKRLAFDIELLDVHRQCEFASYFLLVSGKNRIHIDALADFIAEAAEEKGAEVIGVDGRSESGWVVVDLGDLIIHIFHPDIRHYYNLPGLFGGAKTVELELTAEPETAPPPPGIKSKKRKKKGLL
jgi:ribosome-associated protein